MIKKNKRYAKRLFLFGFFVVFMLGNVSAADTEDKLFKKLQDRYLKKLVNTMLRNQKKPLDVLPRLVPEIKKNIRIDEKLFKSMMSNVLSAKNVTISDEGFHGHELQSRDNVPFRFEGGKVVISARLVDAPESHFFFYMTFMKIYSGLHPDLLENPNVISIGICALLAQEYTYGTTLALLPRFLEETALANLLYCYDKELIRLPFDKNNFDLPAFKSRVTHALGTFLSLRPGHTDSLFFADKKFEIQSLLRNLKPGVLKQFCKKIDKEIHHLTVRFIIYNALFKHFGKDISRRHSRDLLKAFREELKIRYGAIPSRLHDLRFEKSTFSSLFQFIYNGSTVIARKLKAAGLETLDLDNRRGIKEKKDKIIDIVKKEKQLKPLLELIPLKGIEFAMKDDNTSILGFQWQIGRKTTTRSDFEFINVEFERRPVPQKKPPVIDKKKKKKPVPVKKDIKTKIKTSKKGPLGKKGKLKKGKEKSKKKYRKPKKTPKKPRVKKKRKIRKKKVVRVRKLRKIKKKKKGNKGRKEKTNLIKVTIKPSRVKHPISNKPKPKPKIAQQVVLEQTKLPRGWKEREIHLQRDDLQAIRTLPAVNPVKFNLTKESFSRLPRDKKWELIRFIKHFVHLGDSETEQLRRGNLLSQLADGYLESYARQREAFLKYHDIRVLRHMIQKFIFLSNISYVFGNTSNVNVLNQDILEITLRTVLLLNGSKFEGYTYFADLKNSLLYLLKFIQDMKYFHNQEGAGSAGYKGVTVGISQTLCRFVKERLSAINRSINDKSVELAIDDVVGENKINLRNLVSQLDKLKDEVRRSLQTGTGQSPFQQPCTCKSYDSQLYNCRMLADDHIITETGDKKDAFQNCFSRYFSLEDTRMFLD